MSLSPFTRGGAKREEAHFQRFVVHPELGMLVWPNGADFAPEFLRQAVALAA